MVKKSSLVLIRKLLQLFVDQDKRTDLGSDLSEKIDYLARQTPSHLSGYLRADCPELGLGQGGHGEDIAIGYRLTCNCGEQKFGVTAYLWKNPEDGHEGMLSPVTAVCSNCQNSIVVFDSRAHGYNPVVCDFDQTTISGEEIDAAKRKDLSTLAAPETLDIVTYYPEDLFDAEFDDFDKADCFTWITLIVGENTSPRYPMLTYECA